MRRRAGTKMPTRSTPSASSSAPKGTQSLIQGLIAIDLNDAPRDTTSIPRCAFTFRTPQTQPDHADGHVRNRCRITFTDLPLDIIFILMKGLADRLDNCSAVCLGLTCRTYYRLLKRLYPAPISLGFTTHLKNRLYPQFSTQENMVIILHNLLRIFIGLNYRLAAIQTRSGPHFLNRDIYGDRVGPKEKALGERYHDFYLMCCFNSTTRSVRVEHLFPNPYGMGDSWYIRVRMKLRGTTFSGRARVGTVAKHWHKNVKATYAFKRFVEEEFWITWQEGTLMLDL
jgi:hypothetical protein